MPLSILLPLSALGCRLQRCARLPGPGMPIAHHLFQGAAGVNEHPSGPACSRVGPCVLGTCFSVCNLFIFYTANCSPVSATILFSPGFDRPRLAPQPVNTHTRYRYPTPTARTKIERERERERWTRRERLGEGGVHAAAHFPPHYGMISHGFPRHYHPLHPRGFSQQPRTLSR